MSEFTINIITVNYHAKGVENFFIRRVSKQSIRKKYELVETKIILKKASI